MVSKIMLVSVIVNIILSIVKIIFGGIFKCSSLIADGVHSFSDLITDFISILGSKLSLKPADSKHPSPESGYSPLSCNRCHPGRGLQACP